MVLFWLAGCHGFILAGWLSWFYSGWLAVMVLFWLAGCHGFILAGGNALPDNLALAAGILHVLNESIDHCKKPWNHSKIRYRRIITIWKVNPRLIYTSLKTMKTSRCFTVQFEPAIWHRYLSCLGHFCPDPCDSQKYIVKVEPERQKAKSPRSDYHYHHHYHYHYHYQIPTPIRVILAHLKVRCFAYLYAF